MSTPETSAAPEGEAIELSVVVPCHDEELNLPELCDRVLGTFAVGGFRGELILVDDGSKDRTAGVIRALAARHPGAVTGCFHEHNRGIAAAWRTGLAASRGKL